MPQALSAKAREAFETCRRLERARVAVLPALRITVLLFVVLVVAARADRVPESTSLIIGILFVGVTDFGGAYRTRISTMLWATVWLSVATALGGLSSSSAWLHVLLAVVVALASGYAVALGPRGGMIGLLSLVVFALYSGEAIGVGEVVQDVALLVVAGLLITALSASLWPLRRLGGVRRGIAAAYRELAAASERSGSELAIPAVAAEIIAARGELDRTTAGGSTRTWMEALLRDVEQARTGLLGMVADEHRDAAHVTVLVSASARVAQQVARSLVAGRPSRALQNAVTGLSAAHAGIDDRETRVIADQLVTPLLHAAAALQQRPWPIGRHGEGGHVPTPAAMPWPRLRAHAHWGDLAVGHAVRLAVAFAGATLISVLLPFHYTYWLPLTVAWITKPDLGGTVTRVLLRVTGTIGGVLIFAAVYAVTPLAWQPVVILIAITAGGYLAAAYLFANYALTVVGVTVMVFALEVIDGEPLDSTVALRVLATIAAGVWVLFVSLVHPHRAGGAAVDALADAAAALRAYARAIREHGDVDAARSAVLTRRAIAAAAVIAAAYEPRGLFEGEHQRIDPQEAGELLGDVVHATSSLAAADILQSAHVDDPQMWRDAESAMDDLDVGIASLRPS